MSITIIVSPRIAETCCPCWYLLVSQETSLLVKLSPLRLMCVISWFMVIKANSMTIFFCFTYVNFMLFSSPAQSIWWAIWILFFGYLHLGNFYINKWKEKWHNALGYFHLVLLSAWLEKPHLRTNTCQPAVCCGCSLCNGWSFIDRCFLIMQWLLHSVFLFFCVIYLLCEEEIFLVVRSL